LVVADLYSDAKDVKCFPVADEASYTFHPRAYLRPLVKKHPVTGRPALLIGRHAFGIPGLSREDSEKLFGMHVNMGGFPMKAWMSKDGGKPVMVFSNGARWSKL